MTITQDTNSPLVVVAGATGNQGGSVVRALIESEKAYRIRGLTRNALKPATKALKEKGVEIVAVSVTAENKDAVFKAFEGAHVAFLVTNWVDHGEPTRQIAEAKLMIDAAKAGGAKGIIWSGLPSPAALSAGKYTQVVPFESKVLVAEYGRQSGVPFVDVQGGGYASDFLTTKRPRRIAPYADVWQVSFPMAPSLEVPLLDAERDYGLFVRKVIEAEVFPDKATWAAWGEYITMEEQMKQLSEVTGKKVIYRQLSPEDFEQRLKSAGTPAHLLPGVRELFTSIGEFGYYGKDTMHSQDGLARKPRTWREFVEATDWSGVFV